LYAWEAGRVISREQKVAHMFALRNAETGKVLENSSSPEFSFMFASGHDACADAISLNFCKVKPTKWNET